MNKNTNSDVDIQCNTTQQLKTDTTWEKNYAEGKRADPKEFICFGSMYMKF